MASPNTFTRGKDVRAAIRQAGAPVVAQFKSISVKEEADAGWDDVCGEDRSRPYKVTNGFTITLSGYASQFAILDSCLDYIANEDARTAPLPVQIAFKFSLRDGTQVGYVAAQVVPDPFTVDSGDRKGAVMQSISYRCRYFDPATI